FSSPDAGVQTPGLFVLLGLGDGGFLQEPVNQLGVIGSSAIAPNTIGVADLDGDGHLDVVQATGGLVGLYGDGQGGFANPASPSGPGWDTLRVGDFTGDGKADVMLGEWVYPSNGRTLDSPMSIKGPYPCFWGDAVGDFNGDDRTDIVTVA